MKKVYKFTIILVIILWYTFTSMYLQTSFGTWFTGNFKKYEVSLTSAENNEENTLLANELYRDTVKSDNLILYKYNSSSNEIMNTTVLTNNFENLSNSIQNNQEIIFEDYEILKEIKGSSLLIYSDSKLQLDQKKYEVNKIEKDKIDLFYNSYYGIWGLVLFVCLLIFVTIVTLLYQEYNKEKLRSLFLDGNSIIYAYKVLFLKEHTMIMVSSTIGILVISIFLKIVYFNVIFYMILLLFAIISIPIISIIKIFYTFNSKIAISKIILYCFEGIHVIVIILLINFIGSTISLYKQLEPNKEYSNIESKLTDYDCFKQSSTGGDALEYNVAAVKYTEYYNFISANLDVLLAELNNITEDFSEVNSKNNYVLVNSNYFNVFEVFDENDKRISADSFEEDTIYYYQIRDLQENPEYPTPASNPTIEVNYLREGQKLWYIEGSMELYGANSVENISLLVVPDKFTKYSIDKYSVYDYINKTMSTSSILVKDGKDSEINRDYLAKNHLSTTFRKWSNVNDNYQNVVKYVDAKLSLYVKIIIILVLFTIVITLLDIYFYFYSTRRKAAILLLDGNKNITILKPYLINMLVKILIISYVCHMALTLNTYEIYIGIFLALIISLCLIFAFSNAIRNKIYYFIKRER